ncbi:tripartite tricarboxylate transporter TctB family protein [Pseudarthrobacter enclensis]|uniref:Tricarboxylic transport membrane protein n=1 Tax=Pseudarthrobacter enclensis TaxID=993070 RepID=A0ABT9S0D1_9MICC|nr:tripartite tricarboxylate transporter TctB family protein [Pseudarthrobacter enclensis]MDP9889994.1 putative tricarboxylic transport membrane protein [Pseudarthrobacter enclensis]
MTSTTGSKAAQEVTVFTNRARSQWPRVIPIILLLVGVAAMIGAYQLSLGQLNQPGAGLWPFIVGAFLTLTAAVLFFVQDPSECEQWNRRALGIVAGLASLGLFIVLFQMIGFLIPAFLMLALWLKTFGEEPWRLAVPLAVAGAVVMHFLFVVALGVPFPKDIVVTLFSALGV